MFVWQGWGILVVLVTGACLALAGHVVGVATPHQFWLAGQIALLVSAVILFPIGRYLNGRPGRVLVDPATDETVVLRPRHTLFFLAVEYWAIILVIMFVLRFFIDFTTL